MCGRKSIIRTPNKSIAHASRSDHTGPTPTIERLKDAHSSPVRGALGLMIVQHLTILAIVEVRPGAVVEFGAEVEHVAGRYRSRGINPGWGGSFGTVQDAISDEASRVYSSLSEQGKDDVNAPH